MGSMMNLPELFLLSFETSMQVGANRASTYKTLFVGNNSTEYRDPHYLAIIYPRSEKKDFQDFIQERLNSHIPLKIYFHNSQLKLVEHVLGTKLKRLPKPSKIENAWKQDIAANADPQLKPEEVKNIFLYSLQEEEPMSHQVIAVSVETDELAAALFTIELIQDSNPIINIVGGSLKRKEDIAQEGVIENYWERLFTFISDYLIDHNLEAPDLAAITFVHPGEIDVEKGILKSASGRFGLSNLDMRSEIKKGLGFKNVFVFHDGPSLLEGEMSIGIGSEHQDVKDYYFGIVGAGVGGAMFLNNQHYAGATFTAGDIGQIRVNRERGIRKDHILENYTSRYAINQRVYSAFREARQKSRKIEETPLTRILSRINDPKRISTHQLADAVRREQVIPEEQRKDTFALDAIEIAAEYLGYGLAIVSDVLNPQMIILGGPLMESIETYYNRSIIYAKQFAYPDAWEQTTIVRAQKGIEAALWGAVKQSVKYLKL
jgi:glucokinase